MAKNERFQFDDENEIINEQPVVDETTTEEIETNDEIEQDSMEVEEASQEEQPSIDEEVNAVDEPKQEEEEMAKKKKKFKFRWWYTLILLFLAACIAFFAYIYFGSRNNGPVYGERCMSALSLSQDSIQEVISNYEGNEKIESLDIEVECLTMKISITFVPETSKEDGCALAETILKDVDVALGYDKFEESAYSSVFNQDEGENQYDVEFILQSKDSETYPIFGTKHAMIDSISYTTASPANNATTDKVLEQLEPKEEPEEE